MNISNINSYNTNSYSYPTFGATAEQYKSAVKYLKLEKRQNVSKSVKSQLKQIFNGIKHHLPLEFITPMFKHIPRKFNFMNSYEGYNLKSNGIKTLNLDKLDGIQYGIDVFENLSMKEIVFLAYRTMNLAVTRGCANMCEHCFQGAVPAKKGTLSSLPYEDFQKISEGFETINKRINKFLKNKQNTKLIGEDSNNEITGFAAELTGFFFDSDGISVVAKDRFGKEHDFIDLTEIFHKATGKRVIFDSAGWNPKNKKLQERAEKYAKYFSQTNIEDKVEQINLSINTFNPLYTKSYKLGYRPGMENDITNPNIQQGKVLYERYIDRISNMIVTLGNSKNASLLMTYATKYESNMEGMYLADLKLILKDVQKRCDEMLRERYIGEEYTEKSIKINKMIERNIRREENKDLTERCEYAGRFKTLYDERHPKENWRVTPYSRKIIDINNLSKTEYENFLNKYKAVIDTNGQIYYMEYDCSLRSMGKELKLSTNGRETPTINNIEKRD